jgi:hypothetical protein
LVSRYLGGVQHTERRSAKWPSTSLLVLLVASVAVLVTGCGLGEDVMATIGLPTSETAPADPDTQANPQSPALPVPPQAGGQPHTLTVTGQQRGYLDALNSAGVRPSSDLLALSIGTYVCQARAAKQNDQAVWDFVLPLVRSDMRAAHPPAAEVNAATADYIRIATERLC